MSEFSSEMPMPAVPPQCIGCPMIEGADMLFEQSLANTEEFIEQRVEARAAADAAGLAGLLESLGSASSLAVEKKTKAVLADIDAVTAIFDTAPDAATMPVLNFIQLYRTEENQLGDECLMLAMELMLERDPDYDDGIQALTVETALTLQLKALAGLHEVADKNLLLSDEVIASQAALYDTEKLYRDVMDGTAAEHHEASVRKLTSHCDTGVEEVTTGIFKKRVVRYCGSTAYRGKA